MGPLHFDPGTIAATAGQVGSVLDDVGDFLGIGGPHIGPCERQMQRTLEAIQQASQEDVRQAKQAVGAAAVSEIINFPSQSAFCDPGPIPGACSGGNFDPDAFRRAGGEELKPVAIEALEAAGVNHFPDLGCSEPIQAAKALFSKGTGGADLGGTDGDTSDAVTTDDGGGILDRLYETFLQDPVEVFVARLEGGLAGARTGAEANDPRNRSTIGLGAVAVVAVVGLGIYLLVRS